MSASRHTSSMSGKQKCGSTHVQYTRTFSIPPFLLLQLRRQCCLQLCWIGGFATWPGAAGQQAQSTRHGA